MTTTTTHPNIYKYEITKLQKALQRRRRGQQILKDKLFQAEQERDSAIATARRWRTIAKSNTVDWPIAAE